jgi:hypothetical protein
MRHETFKVDYQGQSFEVWSDAAGLDLAPIGSAYDQKVADQLWNQLYDVYRYKGLRAAIASFTDHDRDQNGGK